MAYEGPKKKKNLRMVSHLMDAELFERLKKAASEDNTTMTEMMNYSLSAFLKERDKYYDPNEPQPEDLQREQREADAEFEQWTPTAPKPVEEEDEEIENPMQEDPPPGYLDEPESPDQGSKPESFQFE